MHIDLKGKTVLVTGASRGIGLALAKGLAEAGATVAAHFNQNAPATDALGHGARAFQADLANPAATEGLFHAVIETYGRLDVLINNAGVSPKIPIDAAADAWLEDWDRTIAINLRAVDLLCRMAVRHFEQHGGGRIINVASRAAFRGDTRDFMAYAASKGGVVALTRSIARAFGKAGVAAFVIAPGFVRTDMAQEYIDEYGEEYVVSDLALDHLTEPTDLAPLVVLLASGLADHATGATFDVNAGSYVH